MILLISIEQDTFRHSSAVDYVQCGWWYISTTYKKYSRPWLRGVNVYSCVVLGRGWKWLYTQLHHSIKLFPSMHLPWITPHSPLGESPCNGNFPHSLWGKPRVIIKQSWLQWTSGPNDHQMTLNTKRLKVPHIHIATTPESQISLNFVLRLAISKILASLHCPISYNVKFQSCFLNLNLKFQQFL